MAFVDKTERAAEHPSAPLIALRQVGRKRPGGDGWLLSDAQLAINPGECVGLVGPTGAGKTLLLRAISLLDPTDSGCVLWQGREVGSSLVTAYRSHVIYLHQRPSLLAGSVERNLRSPLSLHVQRHKEFDSGRIVEWLRQLGRDQEFLSRHTRDRSGGERQLLALLRALQLDPSVLLLDEPTAAMDQELALTVERWVATWISDSPANRAVIWVSHDDRQIGRVAQRVLRLDQGRLTNSKE